MYADYEMLRLFMVSKYCKKSQFLSIEQIIFSLLLTQHISPQIRSIFCNVIYVLHLYLHKKWSRFELIFFLFTMFDAYTSLSMFLITKIILNRDKKEQLSITDTRICVNVFIWIKEIEIFLLRHNFYNILNH